MIQEREKGAATPAPGDSRWLLSASIVRMTHVSWPQDKNILNMFYSKIFHKWIRIVANDLSVELIRHVNQVVLHFLQILLIVLRQSFPVLSRSGAWLRRICLILVIFGLCWSHFILGWRWHDQRPEIFDCPHNQ